VSPSLFRLRTQTRPSWRSLLVAIRTVTDPSEKPCAGTMLEQITKMGRMVTFGVLNVTLRKLPAPGRAKTSFG
jgi:hypothetical protein